MTLDSTFAAEILKRSAGGYAGAAASLLLEREPQLRAQAGALDAWKSHLTQRVLELAAALRAGEPSIFSERVNWSRKTFAARNQPDSLVPASLECLRDILNESLPDNAKSSTVGYLDGALAAVASDSPLVEGSELDPDDPADRLALNYLRLALEGDGPEAVALVREAVASPEDARHVYLRVLLPAQKEIGRLWHLNEVSVAEEHLVTATTQQLMAVLRHTTERTAENQATVVSACVQGNIHDMGVRALSDLFYLAGWRSVYLGADVPVADMPAVLDVFQADLLLLGSTLSTHVEPAAAVIAAVREQVDRPVRIMVGGAAFDEAPDLWQKLGADAYAATGDDALAAGATILESLP